MSEKLLLLVGVTTLCMLSPGPDIFLVMRNTVVGRRWHGGLTAVGVLTGNLVHIGYCVFGVAVLLLRSQPAYNAMRIASALYLVFLGIQSFRQAEAAVPDTDQPRSARSRSGYWQGLWNNLLNPKGSLFYLGVFTQLITPDVSIPQTMLLVTVLMTVSALLAAVRVDTADGGSPPSPFAIDRPRQSDARRRPDPLRRHARDTELTGVVKL